VEEARETKRSVPLRASVALTLLVAAAFVALVADEPPWGGDWRDAHYALGMAIGAGAAAVAVAVLHRRRLGSWTLAWIWLLAISGLVLALTCWLALIVRAVD
jgi:hypothetical protein